jgi:hypothetical protein
MKTIRLIGSLLLLLLQVALLRAQTISPAELNTAGGSTATPISGMHLEYAIGNPFQTSVVSLILSPSTVGAREAQEADLAELPQEMKTDILASKAGLKAWPVPSEGPVTLALEGVEEDVEAQVIDQSGKLVQQVTLKPNENKTLQLPGSGIFFIRTSNKEIPTLRLINR